MLKDTQEPIFVIRAKDALAIPTVRAYYRECVEHGRLDQSRHVDAAIQELIEWQEDHPVKYPDHEHVAHPLSRQTKVKAKEREVREAERERQERSEAEARGNGNE